MQAPGDPAARLEDTCAVAASTMAMEAEARRLSSYAIVLGQWRGRGETEPKEVEKALRRCFGVLEGDVVVSCHRPENFLAVFKYPHHRDVAVTKEKLPVRNLDFCIWPWRIEAYGDHCELRHHVRLCLEGVPVLPVHAWNESIAKRVVARACDIDYVEQQSVDREDTRVLCLWAWTCNPSDIPKDTRNKGCSFFKCPRNGLCSFYRFQKAYFDELVDKKIIRICCEEIEELVEEGGEEHSEGAHLGVEGLKDLKTEALEKKLEKMMSKMNYVIVCLVVVVFGVVFKSMMT
ncbi:unnamed protein product [Miscanthus lutarioriparius]|uniref:DUF4283 domain-containing protein n=1 Tax=Miscanthus lutarioriparius TaxID=422564 RepID=A0A811N4K0_9POAL|nr:unnamed protein product [Miscanthus lutarioriparius]